MMAGSGLTPNLAAEEPSPAAEQSPAQPQTPSAEKRKLEEDIDSEENNKKAKVDTEAGNETGSQCEVSSSSPEKSTANNMEQEKELEETREANNEEQAEEEEEKEVDGQTESSDLPVIGEVFTATEAEKESESDAATPQENPEEKAGEKEQSEAQEGDTDSTDKEEMDETASKLLASGISISLIKKKKDEKKEGEEKEDESEKESETVTEPASNPLEVGPNISVTMINKGNSESASNKFTLSLKSQSELIDPKKNDAKSSANILANGLADTISVSKINKPASANASTTQSKGSAGSKPSQPMLGSPPGLGGLLASRGLPMISQPHGMPGLQPRPNGSLRSSLPLASGSVSDQLNLVASGIAEYMRHGIEEILRELSAQGSSEATIKGLQLELEKMQWRHQQEMTEVKQNIDIMLKDMKANMAKESQRTIEEFKKQAEIEKQKAILETKKKQWCAHCGKEAIFYCCWNTSYCDYPCQQAHWPSHMATCSQTNQEEEQQAQDVPEQKPVQPVASTALLGSLNRPANNSMAMNSMNLSNSGVGMTPSSMGFVMSGMGMGMRPGMGMRSPMGVSIRPGIPGQLTISRPYFM